MKCLKIIVKKKKKKKRKKKKKKKKKCLKITRGWQIVEYNSKLSASSPTNSYIKKIEKAMEN